MNDSDMQGDVADWLEQVRHLRLGKPNRLVCQAYFDLDMAVIGRLNKERSLWISAS